MRKINGFWTANRTERLKYIKVLMAKGYTNDESLEIIEKRLFEYNPLGMSFEEMIQRTLTKGAGT